MQLRWPRLAEERVPCVRPDPHHAGEVSLDIAETDGTYQRREVAAKRADCRSARGARVDRDDQKDRGAGQILNHRLGYGKHLGWRAGRGHWTCSIRRAPSKDAIRRAADPCGIAHEKDD